MATAKRSSPNRRKSAATRSRTASSQAAASSPSKRTQAAKKPAAASRSPKTAAASGTTRGRTGTSQASGASTNGATRGRGGSAGRRAGSRNGSARTQASSRSRTSQPQSRDGVVESVKHAGASALRAANRASGPTITVAAAVAGIAGGLMLRQRPKAAMRDGLGAKSRELLHDIDPAAVMAGLGRASMLVSRRGKSLARDIDQVADRAERLGKVLR